MMAAIHADNLDRSRSNSFKSIAGGGVAMKAKTRDFNDKKSHASVTSESMPPTHQVTAGQ